MRLCRFRFVVKVLVIVKMRLVFTWFLTITRRFVLFLGGVWPVRNK